MAQLANHYKCVSIYLCGGPKILPARPKQSEGGAGVGRPCGRIA